MLAAALAAVWGVTFALGKELRSLWVRALDDRDKTIVELKADARAAFLARDLELAEWRKRALDAAERRPPPQEQPR